MLKDVHGRFVVAACLKTHWRRLELLIGVSQSAGSRGIYADLISKCKCSLISISSKH